jgi:hypothetical protein
MPQCPRPASPRRHSCVGPAQTVLGCKRPTTCDAVRAIRARATAGPSISHGSDSDLGDAIERARHARSRAPAISAGAPCEIARRRLRKRAARRWPPSRLTARTRLSGVRTGRWVVACSLPLHGVRRPTGPGEHGDEPHDHRRPPCSWRARPRCRAARSARESRARSDRAARESTSTSPRACAARAPVIAATCHAGAGRRWC